MNIQTHGDSVSFGPNPIKPENHPLDSNDSINEILSRIRDSKKMRKMGIKPRQRWDDGAIACLVVTIDILTQTKRLLESAKPLNERQSNCIAYIDEQIKKISLETRT
jgi:hypothetical protein